MSYSVVLLDHRCIWHSGALWTTSQRLPHQTGCHRHRRIQHPDTVKVCRLAGQRRFSVLSCFAYLTCQDGSNLIIQLLCVCMQQFVWNVCLCVWQVGDEIVISTTSYSAWETEKRLLTAVSGDGLVLNLNQPLNYTHVGQFCLLHDSSHEILFSF